MGVGKGLPPGAGKGMAYSTGILPGGRPGYIGLGHGQDLTCECGQRGTKMRDCRYVAVPADRLGDARPGTART